MAKLSLLKGVTSQTLQLFIQDSTSTTGTGKTGLVFNTASLTCYYARPRATPVAVTLATQTVTGAYSSGGFVELDSTNLPGWYRFDPPDAAFASGVEFVGFHLRGATGMASLPLEIELVDFAAHGQSAIDLKDFADDGYDPATNKVQGVVLTDTVTTYTGNTLQTGDNFARIGATGSGLTSLATQASVTTIDDFLDTEVTTILADLDDLQTRLPAALVSGRIDASVGAMAANTLTATAIAADALTAAKLAADVTTELQTGLATAASIAALNNLSAAGVENAVWDAAMADHLDAGSTGASLNGAGSAGDPWTTALPGAYGAGSAGFVVGTNLNATVGSRLATAGYTAPLDAAATRLAVGLATANLDTQLGDVPTTAELATALALADDAVLAAIAALNNVSAAGIRTAVGLASANLDTQIGAIAAKTDTLPSGIKKNTALANFSVLMIDSADHVSAKTGLTVTATRSLDGAAFGACTNAVTELASGMYTLDLAAGDLNGDVVVLKFSAVGGDDRFVTLVTEP